MEGSKVVSFEYTSQGAAKLLFGLVAIELLLAAAHLYVFVGPGVPWDIVPLLFDLDEEVALPTWFSTVQLFAVGALLLLAALANQWERHLPSSFLAASGLLFVFLSADEGGGVHERITSVVKERAPNWPLFPGDHGAWLLPYATLGLVFLAIATPYLWNAWKRFPRESLIVLAGGMALVGGAVGFEIISYLFLRSESVSDLYEVEVAVEEFLEMAGVSVILYGVLEVVATLCSKAAE